jgi:hypothetical protein
MPWASRSLCPASADFILRRIKERVEVHTVSAGNPHWRPSHPVDNDVIEGEYEVEDRPRAMALRDGHGIEAGSACC